MTTRVYEVAVVGGGLAGRAAAFALAEAGLKTVHIAPPAPPDRRTSALMGPSVEFLRRLGVVVEPAALGHPLRSIRIIDATGRLVRAPETVFEASEAGLDAFGWNFSNAALAAAFERVAGTLAALTTLAESARGLSLGDRPQLVIGDGQTIEADLVVGADGKKSTIRAAAGIGVHEQPFRQAALVADLDLARPIGETSVEFHYEQGPFTLVPAGGRRANLVWIDTRERLDALKADSVALLGAITSKSQRLFGKVELAGPAVVFPLSRLTVERAGKDRVVLVGEAAHAFPPIGAQGLNLGLRDVADLATLASSCGMDPGWGTRLADAYARQRAGDLGWTDMGVDGLFQSLLNPFLPVQLARAGGLWALKRMPPLRRQAFSFGMGTR